MRRQNPLLALVLAILTVALLGWWARPREAPRPTAGSGRVDLMPGFMLDGVALGDSRAKTEAVLGDPSDCKSVGLFEGSGFRALAKYFGGSRRDAPALMAGDALAFEQAEELHPLRSGVPYGFAGVNVLPVVGYGKDGVEWIAGEVLTTPNGQDLTAQEVWESSPGETITIPVDRPMPGRGEPTWRYLYKGHMEVILAERPQFEGCIVLSARPLVLEADPGP